MHQEMLDSLADDPDYATNDVLRRQCDALVEAFRGIGGPASRSAARARQFWGSFGEAIGELWSLGRELRDGKAVSWLIAERIGHNCGIALHPEIGLPFFPDASSLFAEYASETSTQGLTQTVEAHIRDCQEAIAAISGGRLECTELSVIEMCINGYIEVVECLLKPTPGRTLVTLVVVSHVSCVGLLAVIERAMLEYWKANRIAAGGESLTPKNESS